MRIFSRSMTIVFMFLLASFISVAQSDSEPIKISISIVETQTDQMVNGEPQGPITSLIEMIAIEAGYDDVEWLNLDDTTESDPTDENTQSLNPYSEADLHVFNLATRVNDNRLISSRPLVGIDYPIYIRGGSNVQIGRYTIMGSVAMKDSDAIDHYYTSTEAALTALLKEEVEAIWVDGVAAQPYIVQNNLDVEILDSVNANRFYWLIFGADQTELAEIFDTAFETVKSNGAYAQWFEQYMGMPLPDDYLANLDYIYASAQIESQLMDANTAFFEDSLSVAQSTLDTLTETTWPAIKALTVPESATVANEKLVAWYRAVYGGIDARLNSEHDINHTISVMEGELDFADAVDDLIVIPPR